METLTTSPHSLVVVAVEEGDRRFATVDKHAALRYLIY
jgi:hypothetical protein